MELLKEIWQTAQRNKLRTGLTGFAVAWGIFMLIVLLGAGNGLINANMQQSERFLSNSMVVFGGQTSKPYQGMKEGRNISLQTRDLDATSDDFKEHVDEVGARYSISATITNNQEYLSTTVLGVYPNHPKIDKMEMLYGRFINDIDQQQKRKVLVLSNKQAKELEPKDYKSLLGRHVKVNNFMFQVVGIYKDEEDSQASAFSTYSAIKSIFGANTDDAGNIEFTFHGLSTEKENEDFEEEYRHRINANHQAHPEDESAVLLSGIVGVSNIMLITVKERTHEFGIRKAIGAKPWSILKLIITESVIITTFFGYVGMVLGVLANEYMDATVGHDTIDTGLFKATMFLNPTVGLDVCIEATMVMVIAGTVAGLIPAFKASRIRPIEALRAD